MRPKTQYARNRDVHIAYQVVGDGPIDLVFAGAWVSNIGLYWDEPLMAHFLERLASFSRLILVDKRGANIAKNPCAPSDATGHRHCRVRSPVRRSRHPHPQGCSR
jgi:hypothetical protein